MLGRAPGPPRPPPPGPRAPLLGATPPRAGGFAPAAPPPPLRERALAGHLTVDPDRAADAGELLPTAGRDAQLRYALAIRARFVDASGDTTLVTGVAVADSVGARFRWVMRRCDSVCAEGWRTRRPAWRAGGACCAARRSLRTTPASSC